MTQTPDADERLEALRRAFDEQFSAPARVGAATEPLLAVRTAAGRFVIPLAEIAGVHRCPDIVPLPGAVPGLLGLAGIRRRPVAVYSAAALLGAAEGGPARWLLVSREDTALAVTVEDLEGTLHASPAELRPIRGEPGGHVTAVLERDGEARSVLSLASLAGLALRRAGAATRGSALADTEG